MKPQVGTSWEQKMQQKASRQQFLDFKREAVNSAKEKRKVRVRGCVVVLYGGVVLSSLKLRGFLRQGILMGRLQT